MTEHWPERRGCGHVFSVGELRPVGEPARHQVEELPTITVGVIEHRSHRVRCPGSGELPPEVTDGTFGPRLRAASATLWVRNRISRRDVVELAEELVAARTSTGSIDAILARVGAALARPHEDLLERVRGARALHVDETDWVR